MTTLILLAALCYAPGQTAATIGDPKADRSVPTSGVRDADLPPIGPPAWPSPTQPDPIRAAADYLGSHLGEIAVAWGMAFGLLGGYVALRRESSVVEGIVVGAVFGPLGVIVALYLPPTLPPSWRRDADRRLA